jgi:hypothetical protein
VRAAAGHGWEVADIYAPYFVHGLEDVLGWRRSRLPVACFLGGLAGVVLAFWLQFWTTAQDWPINVGGRPWNSLPAFVPVAFESMVLLAGFSLVFAWLFRSGLYPGKAARLPLPGATDDRFLLVLREGSDARDISVIISLLETCGASVAEEQVEEKQR